MIYIKFNISFEEKIRLCLSMLIKIGECDRNYYLVLKVIHTLCDIHARSIGRDIKHVLFWKYAQGLYCVQGLELLFVSDREPVEIVRIDMVDNLMNTSYFDHNEEGE